MLSLEEWLDANCRYLEQAVKELPAKAELQPLFSGLKDGTPLVFGLDLTRVDKPLAIDLFQAGLEAMEADQYAIIAAAWYLRLPDDEQTDAALQVIRREGTGGAYKGQRRECYAVTVGDRERSLMALFDVERDYKGKIRRLIRQTQSAPAMFGGMVDLLVDRTVQ